MSNRARSLVARERRRIEAALADLTGEEQAEDESQFDQTGESGEAGADVQHELVDEALAAALQDELAAVVRAEARIADGTYGRSVEAAHPSPTSASRPSPSPNARSRSSPSTSEASASASGRSAKGAAQAHLVERALENGELLVVESLDEQRRHTVEMDGHRLREPGQAGVGQRDDDSAAVRDGARPSDEPFLDQAVDAASHRRSRAECLGRQLGHAELAAGTAPAGRARRSRPTAGASSSPGRSTAPA